LTLENKNAGKSLTKKEKVLVQKINKKKVILVGICQELVVRTEHCSLNSQHLYQVTSF
jgi:hypothetical protein